MAADALPEVLTLAEVARVLRLSRRKAGEMARNGHLPAFRVGGLWRVRRSSLEAWLDELERAHSAGKVSKKAGG
jgi:excisionase family DNA binding protein